MNLNNFHKRYYFENDLLKYTAHISKEFDKEVLWTIFNNQVSTKLDIIDQIFYALRVKSKLPKDFLKNL